jgi:hypothetical protein
MAAKKSTENAATIKPQIDDDSGRDGGGRHNY